MESGLAFDVPPPPLEEVHDHNQAMAWGVAGLRRAVRGHLMRPLYDRERVSAGRGGLQQSENGRLYEEVNASAECEWN